MQWLLVLQSGIQDMMVSPGSRNTRCSRRTAMYSCFIRDLAGTEHECLGLILYIQQYVKTNINHLDNIEQNNSTSCYKGYVFRMQSNLCWFSISMFDIHKRICNATSCIYKDTSTNNKNNTKSCINDIVADKFL